MINIEKRARELYPNGIYEKDAYTQGVAEQKGIMMDIFLYYCEGNFSGWREFKAHFRKAMEE